MRHVQTHKATKSQTNFHIYNILAENVPDPPDGYMLVFKFHLNKSYVKFKK